MRHTVHRSMRGGWLRASTPGILWLAAILLSGCKPQGGAGGRATTNLSLISWPAFEARTNSYYHVEHLHKLLLTANTILATNPAILSQLPAYGKLPDNLPLRALLSIPADEPAYVTGWESIAQRCIIVRSSITEQRFGQIKVNLQTGRIDSVYDVEALVIINEMERRMRQIVGTREEALRLFRGRGSNSPSMEQEQAIGAVASALFLPKDKKLYISMIAPGGSNEGQGNLSVDVLSASNSLVPIAEVDYPIRGNLLHALGLSRPSYRFGGLRLCVGWTNLNPDVFLLDSERVPYPRLPGP